MPQSAQSFRAIIVSFHTGPVLDQCLNALLVAPLCHQIVLINNGNTSDVTAALLARAKAEPKLSVMAGHGNIGFAQACNLGAVGADDGFLVFVNPDCVIDSATLPAFGDALIRYPDSLIGGALRNEDGSEQRGCRRGELTPWSAFVSFTGFGRPGSDAGMWRDFNRTKEHKLAEVENMPVVSGALMALRADLFHKVGGFDAGFFLHVEDVDLCRRIADFGGLVKFAPQATALHIGASSNASSWSIERAKIASFGHYFWKNAKTFSDYLAIVLLMPVLASAIVMRMMVGQLGRK